MFNNKNNSNPGTTIDENLTANVSSKASVDPQLATAPDPAAIAPAIGLDNSNQMVPKGPVANTPVPVKTTLTKGTKVNPNQLAKLRDQALTQLRPIVDELDQPPKEQFRTLMMLIQSGDSSDLIEKALSAAGSIEDSRDRAQALLDIVNEINYFNQKK